MSGPRYDLVPHVGTSPPPPEAVPRPSEPPTEHGYPPDCGSLHRPGKIAFAAIIAFLGGLLVASCTASILPH